MNQELEELSLRSGVKGVKADTPKPLPGKRVSALTPANSFNSLNS